jgi:CheY-like chemotaxis protein
MKTFPVASRQVDPCILLVDDNRNGLIARRAVLEEEGYQVRVASDGQEALELFLAGRYDLVVTDYRMPRMDGIELIARMRQARPEVPALLLSGFVEPLGLNEQNTGADAIVAKNSHEVQNLLRAVGRLLNRRARNGRPAPRKPVTSQRRPPKARAAAR